MSEPLALPFFNVSVFFVFFLTKVQSEKKQLIMKE